MSKVYYIASGFELPEDDFYTDAESDWNALCIFLCDDPSYEVDPYIKKDYVYNLTGNTDEKRLTQLIAYLKENIAGGVIAHYKAR